jgi:methyltransferase (TIGR00027 family)
MCRDEPDGRTKGSVMTETTEAPDSTAVRVALWRALHVEIDAPPHVFEDEVGLQLADPDDGWRERGDMHPEGTSTFRASIVARARFVEDLVTEQSGRDLAQYVILGAGLDTFAQRRTEIASRLRVFEVDQPGTQAWKRRRLIELGFDMPDWLHLVPVDFDADESWWERLVDAGFDPGRSTIVASAGVTMYLTRDANAATLRQVAALAPGSAFVTTFLLPAELLDDAERAGLELAERGARASGTPFISFFAPEEMLAMGRDAGFREARHVSAADLNERYFAGRTDGLRTSRGEELLVATT